MTRPDRHRFVTLKSSWRDHARISSCGVAGGDLLLDWIDSGKPLVVASSAAGDAQTTVRLGLSTPEKRRLGLCVQMEAIDGLLPPVTLEDAAAAAPDAWQGTVRTVLTLAAQHGLDLSVFGSLAWSHLSGESHLRPGSDLDLIVSTSIDQHTPAAILALLAIDDGPRLDGELMLADSAGVNLREYAAQPDRVLVKKHGGPEMVELASLVSPERRVA